MIRWLKRVVGKLLFTSFLLADEDGRRYAVTVNRFGAARARWTLLPPRHVNCVCSEWCPPPQLEGGAFEKLLHE